MTHDAEAMTTVVCLHCRAETVAKKPNKKFCGDRCRGTYRRGLDHEPPAFVGDVAKLPVTLTRNFTIGDPDECWVYAKRCGNGYASGTSVNNYKGSAYRLLYLLMVGPIPEGTELDHTCDNGTGGCVNWHHLNPTTHQDNTTRTPRTLPGQHIRKTHCPKGHPYSGSNLILYGPNKEWRRCRTCNAEQFARCTEKHKEAYRESQRRYEQSPQGKAKKAERQRRHRERQKGAA